MRSGVKIVFWRTTLKTYTIKGDSMIEVDKDLGRTQKMYPCDICGKIFSWDEYRVSQVVNGVRIWRHESCGKKKN